MVDLRKDAVLFRETLRRCTTRYSVGHNSEAGRPYYPPVTRIDFVYSFGDGTSVPWVYLNLDTKAGSEPDGTPTHPLFELIEQTEWGMACHYLLANDNLRMTLIMPDGKQADCNAEEFRQIVGDFLVQSLIEARDQNVLLELPKAPRCEMGVSQYGGGYGWPTYEQRGSENLAEQRSVLGTR